MRAPFRTLGSAGGFACLLLVAGATTDLHAQNPVTNSRVPEDLMASSSSGAAGQRHSAGVSSADRGGCLIEPAVTTEVAAGAPGVLATVAVERGQRVSRGQVLAVLDHDVEKAMVAAAQTRAQARSAIEAARATRDMARRKVQRMNALNRLSAGATLELELAQSELEVAEHRLRQAEEAAQIARQDHEIARQQFAQREVRSPIDGIVADRLLEPGERVDGRPIVRLMTLDTLRVELVLPAERFGSLRPDMVLEVTPDIGGTGGVPARVVQVDPFVDAASATFRARLSLANAGQRVPAGARCTVAMPAAPTPRGS